jgi:3-polyprenyl-4-hydroxybenzoate decarboxylase
MEPAGLEIVHSAGGGIRSFSGHSIKAIPREADLFQALSRSLPGLGAVHVPLSGCGLFHAYISMEKTAEG